MSFSSISLKWRAACLMSLLAVLVLLVSGAVQGRFLRASLRELATEQEAALIERVAADVDAKFDAAIQSLQLSGESLPVDQIGSVERLHQYFARRRELTVFFDRVYVFAPDGRTIAQSGPENVTGMSVADRPHFRRALASGRPVISDPFLGRVRGEPVVQVTVPVLREGRVVAVLGGILRLFSQNFLSDLAGVSVGHTGYLMLISKGGQPVYVMHPDGQGLWRCRRAGGGGRPSQRHLPRGVHGTLRKGGICPALLSEKIGQRHRHAEARYGIDRDPAQGGRSIGKRKQAMTRKSGIAIESGSGNVYADIGAADAGEMLVKAGLAHEIAQIIASRRLTQQAASELLGMPQPKLSEMLRGRFRGISQAKMIQCLNRLGRDVQIVVKKAGRRPVGHTQVVVA